MKRVKKPTPIHVFDEHNDAFYFWQKTRYEGYFKEPLDLFHIDAHEDMGRPESFRDSIYAPPDARGGYLKYYEHFARNELHISTFIIPAVLNGLVKNVYCIFPKWRKFKSVKKRFNVSSAFGEGKILKYGIKVDKETDQKLFKALPDLKYYNYSVQDISGIPKNRKVLLDIDLDYFACRDSILNHLNFELEITEEQFLRKEAFLQDQTLQFAGLDFGFAAKNDRYFAQIAHRKGKDLSHLPSREEIKSEIHKLVDTLQAKKTRPAVVTISRSCISGFCPKDYYEFIETELLEKLKIFLDH